MRKTIRRVLWSFAAALGLVAATALPAAARIAVNHAESAV
jgi:hypothetical protein